jgi:phospholipid/cholesterol/gamma-HCH transport system substrate-binding protein
MKAAGRDLMTGLVALAGLAGLAALLFIFGEVRNVFAKTLQFEFRVDNAAGLKETSDVAVQGVRVGTIVSIENAADDPNHGVDVRVKVRDGTRIPRDFTIYLDKGFVGDSVLDIQIPPSADSLRESNLVRNGEKLPGTRSVDSLFKRVEESLAAPLDKLGKLADTYTRVGEKAEDLVTPRTLKDVEAGKAANLWTTVERVDRALTAANAWLEDESLRGEVKEIASRAKAMVEEAEKAAASVRTAADSLRETSDAAKTQIQTQGEKIGKAADELTARATASLRRIDDAAGEIQKIAVGVNAGEGTLGQLAKNPDLYNSVRDAAVRLERALSELQLLIQKLKDEGVEVNL